MRSGKRNHCESRLEPMPRLSALLAMLGVGLALFVLFAFTVVGLVGEAIVLISVLGLITRLFSAVRRWRGHR